MDIGHGHMVRLWSTPTKGPIHYVFLLIRPQHINISVDKWLPHFFFWGGGGLLCTPVSIWEQFILRSLAFIEYKLWRITGTGGAVCKGAVGSRWSPGPGSILAWHKFQWPDYHAGMKGCSAPNVVSPVARPGSPLLHLTCWFLMDLIHSHRRG